MWSKSILNARCKICRKKGDAENMVLCDGCDRGHHTYCVRPKLKVVDLLLLPPWSGDLDRVIMAVSVVCSDRS